MFGLGRKKTKDDPGPPPLDLRQDGVGYAGLTTAEAVDAAVAAGRLERFPVMGLQFGGPDLPDNQLAGPPGAAAAKDWIDDQISAALARGGSVEMDVAPAYDAGGSRVPRSVTFALGDAGTHTLHFW